MQVPAHPVVRQVEARFFPQTLSELIRSLDTDCTATLEQQVRTIKGRRALREKLAENAVALWRYVTQDDQVSVVNDNPFKVDVPFRALMLEPVRLLAKHLDMPGKCRSLVTLALLTGHSIHNRKRLSGPVIMSRHQIIQDSPSPLSFILCSLLGHSVLRASAVCWLDDQKVSCA